MYMAGRFRTASRPSSTLIWSASYESRCPFMVLVSSVAIGLLFLRVPDLHRHDDAQEARIPVRLQYAGAQGAADLQTDFLAVHDGQRVEEIAGVEPGRQALPPVLGG